MEPSFWERLLWAFARPRVRLAVIGLVICVAALSGTLLFLSQLQRPTVSYISTNENGVLGGLPTDTSLTATATSSATVRITTPHATATPKKHTNPPPPPVPTAPPTATPCPTPTSLPKPTPTATNTAAAPTATANATPTAAPTATATGQTGQTGQISGHIQAMPLATCQPCPYYKGNNPSQSQIHTALNTAADAYGLPRNLLLAVAWQESRWHEDVTSCDGGIGLMQVQYYTYPWLNTQSVPACNLGATDYDPYTLQGNAYLGAKFLKWLMCFYSYWGNNGGASVDHPGQYTIAWYYQQAGLDYPDTTNPDGSLCAAVFNANAYYAALPSTTAQPWPCPYSATEGDTPLLDATLSAYNEGPGTFDESGVLNPSYVSSVEGYITQFANGALP